MQCHEFLQHTERWMEGERDATAAAHLKSCANCSSLVADLEAIQNSALQLAEVEPPARVWVSLQNQLEVEGLIHEPEEAPVALPAKSRPGFAFGLRPALATAFLAVLVISGAYLSTGRVGAPRVSNNSTAQATVPGSEVMLELAALAPLAKAQAPEIHEHNPAVKAAYRQNLEIVDNAIAMCEKALKEQPKNDMALEYLRGAYQQKAELLASMSQHGATGD
ncbi:MAG: hypothetical protein HY046_05360 [Acidobacteria bacterium]|nr:hypothetical protein [Acidobacteriota bacterium]